MNWTIGIGENVGNVRVGNPKVEKQPIEDMVGI
jgi:hypothetical protein